MKPDNGIWSVNRIKHEKHFPEKSCTNCFRETFLEETQTLF